MTMRGWLLWALVSVILSIIGGTIAWLNPGHHGHDLGAGIACGFVIFALTFIGPNGLAADGTPD